MAKVLSMREQLDCLIFALELGLESIENYAKTCEDTVKKFPEDSSLYALNFGMQQGAEFAAKHLEEVLSAAKKQRRRWNNETGRELKVEQEGL